MSIIIDDPFGLTMCFIFIGCGIGGWLVALYEERREITAQLRSWRAKLRLHRWRKEHGCNTEPYQVPEFARKDSE